MRWLRELFGKRRATQSHIEPVSVVVLLRRPLELSDDQLLALADKTWGSPGPDGRASPTLIGRIRIPTGSRSEGRLLNVDKLCIAVLTAEEPYFPHRKAKFSGRQDVFEAAWNDHSAWLSIDYHRTKSDKPASRYATYQFLLQFANHVWDDNCLGLYLPLEGVTLPRVGSLIDSLKWWVKHEKRSPFPDGPGTASRSNDQKSRLAR